MPDHVSLVHGADSRVPSRVRADGQTHAPTNEVTADRGAQRVIGEWIGFYNTERPHSALAGQTPAEAHGNGRPVDMMDKPDGLPTYPQAQQQQQDVINRILAA